MGQVPNTLPTDVFKNTDKQLAKEKMGFAKGKFIFLSGFMPSRKDLHKGTSYLLESLELLKNRVGAKADEIEFLRWREERWMKLAHFPKAVWQRPGFVFHHGVKMLKHTFRGCTLRTLLGLEDEREACESPLSELHRRATRDRAIPSAAWSRVFVRA